MTVTVSDKRLKKNIQSIDKGIEIIEKLKPSSYEWKDDKNNTTRLGLIAQDVNKVIPEATFVNKTDGYMGIHDNHIMAVMIKAIQDQQQIINEQNKKIISLEKNNEKKDKIIKNIENKLYLIMNRLNIK